MPRKRISEEKVIYALKQLEAGAKWRNRLAEGVGFEPTVGCPTLDFESSALNRTQPPFLLGEAPNVERPMSIAECKFSSAE